MTITVSLPYYQTPESVRRAVESVLGQTHEDLVLVVVNDGDAPETAWAPLRDLDDPRLVLFDLPENRGRYFCDAVTLAACVTPYWTTHDSDDWSDLERLKKLFSAAPGNDAVFGGYTQHRKDGSTKEKHPKVEEILGSDTLRHVAHHTGLYRTAALRSIGGPHPQYRVAWDTFQVAVVANLFRWAVVPDPLYHYQQRPGSLVQAPATSMKSEYRQKLRERLAKHWQEFRRSGKLPPCDPTVRGEVDHHAERLREILDRPALALTG